MRVLITGTSSGIGKATAEKFLRERFEVVGFDIEPSTIIDENFSHYDVDVAEVNQLPDLEPFDYVINNAATADEDYAIQTNLVGYINIAEKYAFHPGIKSVVNVGSTSGINGLDRPVYAASQGGRISYSHNLAIRLGNLYKCPVNCMAFGPVITGLEPNLYSHAELVQAVADENLMKRWISCEECAEWIYFLAVVNKSMTGQCILCDAGEERNFNWIESEVKHDVRRNR
jgi:3-oxoacyl-[acyl-carrier protein] reductase